MTNERLRFLRGKVERADKYEAPGAPRSSLQLPAPSPSAHKTRLLGQLDAIQELVAARSSGARDREAEREIIAITPQPGFQLLPQALASKTDDVRLVGAVPETGVVLLDAAGPDLPHLRAKIDKFADDSQVTVKSLDDESTVTTRSQAKAVAPIAQIALATVSDREGSALRTEDLQDDRRWWFEIACRGGYRSPEEETASSRGQIQRALTLFGVEMPLPEYQGPEQAYFWAYVSPAQLRYMAATTDCIYDVELAANGTRDWLVFEDDSDQSVDGFELEQPSHDAPSVVVLDSGIATTHPALGAAILSATSALEGVDSGEDTSKGGHGTKMAGLCLHRDLVSALQAGAVRAEHWLQSVRILVEPSQGTAADTHCDTWPVTTLRAVEAAETADPTARNRVFVMAVTRSMQTPSVDGPTTHLPPAPVPSTLWSHSIDRLTYDDGRGRLFITCAGNARLEQWTTLASEFPFAQLTEKIHQPAQAANALTVGAYTSRNTIPPGSAYSDVVPVASTPEGISPYTSCGLGTKEWPIKPEVVFEGGNLGMRPGPLPDATVPTLSAITTSNRHRIGLLSMTSEASARAANLAARIWKVEPDLWPETVRALIVHSARWTRQMSIQFPGKDDRLSACGYGLPDEDFALRCASDRATIVFQDEMPNGVHVEEPKKTPPKRATTKRTDTKLRRRVRLFRVPLPDDLLTYDDPEVELKVTLSYFPEPTRFMSSISHGLGLRWDMQGPEEPTDKFLERVNAEHRKLDPKTGRKSKSPKTTSFQWEIGPQRRGRGTIQADRWRGRMSSLAGDKLIAVVPVLGWWDRRNSMRTETMRYSLVVSVCGPGIYSRVQPLVELEATAVVSV